MKICYIDESGGTENPELDPSSTPVMAICALIIDAAEIRAITREYVSLKTKHFATKFTAGLSLDHILSGVKGTQLLSLSRSSSRNQRRQATKFRSELVDILKRHGALVMGRIWVKDIANPLDSRKTYGYAMQDFAKAFNHYLESMDDIGIIIADSREHRLNVQVAHSIFTQKWKSGGDAYRRIQEVPIFAASDNHAGIQIADLLATTFMFPMATAAYCPPRLAFVHQPAKYEHIRSSSGAELEALLYRYTDSKGYRRGGIQVTDAINGAPGSRMFAVPLPL